MVQADSPKANLERCYQNEELIHAFGVFSFDQKENAEHYDKYSTEYDNMQTMTGFNDPYELVKVCHELLESRESNVLANVDAKIVDFGCGTGLMGIELKKRGFNNIYGLDGSQDMLNIAKEKGIYKESWKVLVGLDALP